MCSTESWSTRTVLVRSAVIGAGESAMSAGTAFATPSTMFQKISRCIFSQIWITPAVSGLTPSFEQLKFTKEHGQANCCSRIRAEHPGDGERCIRMLRSLFRGCGLGDRSATI